LMFLEAKEGALFYLVRCVVYGNMVGVLSSRSAGSVLSFRRAAKNAVSTATKSNQKMPQPYDEA